MSRRFHRGKRRERSGPSLGRNAHQHAALGRWSNGSARRLMASAKCSASMTSAPRRSAMVRATAWHAARAPRAQPPASERGLEHGHRTLAQRRDRVERLAAEICIGAHAAVGRAFGGRVQREPRPPRSTPRSRLAATGRHRAGTPRLASRNDRAAGPILGAGTAPAPTASNGTDRAVRPHRTGTGSWLPPAGTSRAIRRGGSVRTRINPSSSG